MRATRASLEGPLTTPVADAPGGPALTTTNPTQTTVTTATPGASANGTTITVPAVPSGDIPGNVNPAPADEVTAPDGTKSASRTPGPKPAPEPAPPADPDAWKVEDLPTGAQKMIAGLRKEAADHRVQAKTAEATAKETAEKLETFLAGFAKVMGLTGDDAGTADAPPDPAKLTAELETAQARQREALVRIAVYEAAAEHRANPKTLTDSVSFLGKVNKLDPGADDFAARVSDAVRDAVDSNPTFRAGLAPASPPAPSGGQFAGGPGRPRSAEDMSVEDFRKTLVSERRPA